MVYWVGLGGLIVVGASVYSAIFTHRRHGAIKGIGGWLFLLAAGFVLTTVVFGYLLVHWVVTLGHLFSVLPITFRAQYLLLVAVFLLSICANVLMVRWRPRFPAVGMALVLLLAFLPIGMYLALGLGMNAERGVPLIKTMGGENLAGALHLLVIGVVVAVVGVSYLLKAERVANTYRPAPAAERPLSPAVGLGPAL